MKNNAKIDFKQISEKLETIIDMADDQSVLEDYPTLDLLDMVEKEFTNIISSLYPLPDIDMHADM